MREQVTIYDKTFEYCVLIRLLLNLNRSKSTRLPDEYVDFVVSVRCEQVRLGLMYDMRAEILAHNNVPRRVYTQSSVSYACLLD